MSLLGNSWVRIASSAHGFAIRPLDRNRARWKRWAPRGYFHYCLQSNYVSRQLSMRFNARYGRFSIYELALSKQQATRYCARRKEESLNLQDYTVGELSTAEYL